MLEIKGKTMLKLNINGEDLEVVVKPSDTLLDTLRNELGPNRGETWL